MYGVDGKSGGGEVQQPPKVGRKEAEMVAEVCAICAQPRPAGQLMGFYDSYVLHGLHFRPVQPGLVIASYKVPARLAVMLLRFVCKNASFFDSLALIMDRCVRWVGGSLIS